MAEALTQVSSEVGKDPPPREGLLDKLDELWEQYLYLLDEYQNTRNQLSDALSTGYFALAQANFSNPSRTRYGQDYYDSRMQALRKVVIEPADEPWIFEVVKEKQASVGDDSPAASNEDDANAGASERGADSSKPTDPLRWFGILLPQALRSAQTSFTQAAEGPVPRLATISRQMRTLEVEMSRLRKSVKKLG